MREIFERIQSSIIDLRFLGRCQAALSTDVREACNCLVSHALVGEFKDQGLGIEFEPSEYFDYSAEEINSWANAFASPMKNLVEDVKINVEKRCDSRLQMYYAERVGGGTDLAQVFTPLPHPECSALKILEEILDWTPWKYQVTAEHRAWLQANAKRSRGWLDGRDE